MVTPTPAPRDQASESDEGIMVNRLDLTGDAVQYWSNPNNIHDLLYDGHGLWAATYGGLVRWVDENDYRLYTVRDGLPSQAVATLALDGEGRLWLGYADVDGWTVRQGDEWQHYDTRRQAVEANHGVLLGASRTHPRMWVTRGESNWVWLPRGDGTVQAYDGNRWRVYGQDSGVTAKSHWVGVSPEGRVWAVGQGVSTAEEGELWWDDHTFFSEVTGAADVTGVVVDDEGAVWIGFANQEGGGLIRYNLAVDRWEGHLPEINPAIPAQVYALELTTDGSLWVAGQGLLSYRAPYRRFHSYELGDLRVLSFARDDQGQIWLGSDQGLYWLDLETEEIHGPWVIPSPLPDNQITGLAMDAEGIIYVGTPRGVSWIDAQGETDLLSDLGVTWLGTCSDGTLWAATSDGLGRFIGEGEFEWVYEQGAVLAVWLAQEGMAYFVTAEGVLMQADSIGPDSIGPDSIGPEAGEAEALVDMLIWTGVLPGNLVVDSLGTIWLATAEGLAQVDANGTRMLHTADDGLLSKDVRAVALDVDDTLWMATARGLARRRNDGRWTRFTVESTGGGLRSMDMLDVSVGPLGDLWMATHAGLSRREPEETRWSYLDVPGAQRILYDGRGGIWVATRAGMYRIAVDALAAP